MATKEQEYKALNEIRKIVDEIGGMDSYVGIAFDGCFEIAEENIESDFACSMKQRAESAELNARNLKGAHTKATLELDEAKKTISHLQNLLEREQEWEAYEIKENVSQTEYNHLAEQDDTKFLTDEEAKQLLCDWFGFHKSRIVIHKSVPKYEKNRHHVLRKVGTLDRRPAYYATDWNYIRFNCGKVGYELFNDELRLYTC